MISASFGRRIWWWKRNGTSFWINHHFLPFCEVSNSLRVINADLPLAPRHRKQASPSLKFTLMGPKLYVNTTKVDSNNRPVTGVRLSSWHPAALADNALNHALLCPTLEKSSVWRHH
ncbi:MACPF domain-containing protein NSL1 [Cucumis melo var. makuwa]|uniref:MACPF domain-containing protein NSL1 n=1 Tax=Cucumis melo var. makuwa TaxID=1194695 RepID=A0A5D3BBQ5_CUCMM|nr:MACPF domain-containing protein NSL1 [Cucumis melo var. makuwa]